MLKLSNFMLKAIFFMDWLGPAGEGFKSMG